MVLNISIVIKSILLQNLFLIFLILRYSNSYNIEEDDIDLPYNLGYSQGIHKGTDSISRDTLQKILLGVEKGDKDNIYFYGLLKLYGISLSQDSSVAAEYFLRAAKLGHKEATTAYGVSLLYGYGVEKDTVAATKWFRNGITLGDMDAYWLLGKLLLDGQGVVHNSNSYVEAATLFHTAAEQGRVPQAEYYLALMYEYGHGGVEKNFDSALEYYKRAAQQNHLESMYNLALMYAYGRGCVQNFDLARPLLEAAAERNHAQSIYYIGIFKTYGYGYKVNYEQAVNWFEKAAGLDDRAVSEKAAKAAKELKEKLIKAYKKNEDILNSLQAMSESQY